MDKNKKEELNVLKTKPFWINFSILSVFTAVSILLESLCLNLVKDGVFFNFKTLFSIGAILLTLMAYGLSVFFYVKGFDSIYKVFISGFVLIISVLAVLYLMLETGFFEVINSTEKFKEYLEGAGAWMSVAYIVLQFLQVLILPIPSFVSVAVGVALFGAIRTLIFSYLAIVPASIIAFFVGRKLGTKAVAWMIGKDTLEKWQKKLKGKDNLILSTMFLLPLFPDDILCFVAGLSSMSNKYFIVMILICRLVNLTGTTFSINFIPFNTWWGICLWI
ncbi:MAG: TVP38/TMEM64 family protein, partial [Clostridiales bacterium]|nr:TVP38/TMEM64 family protein [Clostridiales bacterium]